MTTILIVDDEPAIRRLLEQVLRPEANRLLLTGSAHEAIAAATSGTEPFDLALVDKNLPDRSGLELITDLKGLQPDAEAILITGYATLESAIQAMQVGASDYLVKPFRDIREVTAKVQKALSKRRESAARRALMQGLLETEDTQRQIFEAMLDAAILYDAGTRRIEDVNDAAIRVYQYTRTQLLQMRIDQLRGPAVDQVFRDAPYLRSDMRRDGSRFVAEVSSSSFLVSDRVCCLDVIRDVKRTDIDVNPLLVDLEEALAATAGRPVEITLWREPCLATVLPSRLQQVLLLLAMYTRGALAKADAKLTIESRVEESGDRRVALLTVSGPQPGGEEAPLAALQLTLESLGAVRISSLNDHESFAVQLRLPGPAARTPGPVSRA